MEEVHTDTSDELGGWGPGVSWGPRQLAGLGTGEGLGQLGMFGSWVTGKQTVSHPGVAREAQDGASLLSTSTTPLPHVSVKPELMVPCPLHRSLSRYGDLTAVPLSTFLSRRLSLRDVDRTSSPPSGPPSAPGYCVRPQAH